MKPEDLDLGVLLKEAEEAAAWCRQTGNEPSRFVDWPGTLALVAKRAIAAEVETRRLREAMELAERLLPHVLIAHRKRERHVVSVVDGELEHHVVDDGCVPDCLGCERRVRRDEALAATRAALAGRGDSDEGR